MSGTRALGWGLTLLLNVIIEQMGNGFSTQQAINWTEEKQTFCQLKASESSCFKELCCYNGLGYKPNSQATSLTQLFLMEDVLHDSINSGIFCLHKGAWFT